MKTYRERGAIFYKPSKTVCSGLFVLNTFKEMFTFLDMYSFKKNNECPYHLKSQMVLVCSLQQKKKKKMKGGLLAELDNVLKMICGS